MEPTVSGEGQDNPPKGDSPVAIPTSEVVDRYLAGESLLSEQIAVQAWREGSQASDGAVLDLQALLGGQERSVAPTAIDIERRATKILCIQPVNTIEQRENPTRGALREVGLRPPRVGPAWQKQIVLYTGLLVALATLSIARIIHSKDRRQESSISRGRFYATAAGQQMTIVLADGSRMLLGPATRASVSNGTSEERTNIRVLGQAFFTIHPSDRQIFHVQAGHASADVLGTAFLIRCYPTDHLARVVVTEGKVLFASTSSGSSGQGRRVLVQNTLATVNDSGAVNVTPAIAVDEYTGWIRGQLVFRKTPVRDLVVELSRAYGVNIRVVDSVLARRTVSWSIPLGKYSLAGVIEFLSDVLDAHTVRTGQMITFIPGRVSSHQSRHVVPSSFQESQYGK